MNTKRCRQILFFYFFIFLFFPFANVQAQAGGSAIISLSPAFRTVEMGDEFTVNVVVDPRGEELDTVRAIINFDKNKLQAEYFAMGDLYSASSPGNYIDNAGGVVSHGGARFGGSVGDRGVFGAVTFKALKTGRAEIFLTGGSHLIRAGVEKIDATNLGGASITINEKTDLPPGPDQIIIASPSHPDPAFWYQAKAADLNWRMTDGSKEVVAYLYDFTADPETDPAVEWKGAQKSFVDAGDGIWYFHVKARFADNSFSEIFRYKIMIDATAPRRFEPVLERKTVVKGEDAILRFGAIDDASGIDFYEVALDGQNFQQRESPYKLENLSGGGHVVIVRAVDKAGNVTANAAAINVLGERPFVRWWKYVFGGLALLVVGVALTLLLVKKK